jgi:hypothetical protein
MKRLLTDKYILLSLLFGLLTLTSCSKKGHNRKTNEITTSQKQYIVVKPGTHPSLLFSKQEIGELKEKAKSDGFAGKMWRKIKQQAKNGWTLRNDPYAKSNKLGMKIDAKALIYEVEGNKQAGRQALAQMKKVLDKIDPHHYYFEEGRTNVFWTDDWPKEFAFAYDWLYPLMTKKERTEIADQLKLWCKALYTYTQKHWWKPAIINVGAIPVGALGLLCIAIEGEESGKPEFDKWLHSAVRRIRDNYFPTTWRQNGICYEGPDYAQYCKNPLMFGEALRRNGGPDIVSSSGAINAMHYQRFQWKPGGEEGRIGDNTDYGQRVFQPIYLLGIRQMRDKAGLYTFLKWVDPKDINPMLAFIFYPQNLKLASAASQKLPTSYYFEITPNKAGYLYSRSEWGNKDAAYFAFVTRYEEANHQHYDMDSFLFSAFDENFATHSNIYPYRDSLHGVDWEHNLVIVDGGEMPSHDAIDGAGDDCSLYGYMTGVSTGHFADYVRGDAARSYKDRSLKGSKPALRAERYGAFVKQGPNPYVIMVDDIRKSKKGPHTYDWLWHTEALKLAGGSGSLKNPLIIPGKKAYCEVGFVTPRKPQHNFKIVHNHGGNTPDRKLGVIDVQQRGNRVQFFAIGAAWKKGRPKPTFRLGPKPTSSENAYSLIVKGQKFTDYILWQPEESKGKPGKYISSGNMATNAFLSVVRTDDTGKVTGYLMGDGTKLVFQGKVLVKSDRTWSVSADAEKLVATGKRRARRGLSPLPAKGQAWLPGKNTRIRTDGKAIKPRVTKNRMAVIR